MPVIAKSESGVGGGFIEFASKLRRTIRSPLTLVIAAVVFISTLLVEFAILFPTYEAKKQELFASLDQKAQALSTAAFSGEFITENAFRRHLRRTVNVPDVLGVMVIDSEGSNRFATGETIDVDSIVRGPADIGRHLDSRGDRYDVVWPVNQKSFSGVIAVRFDSRKVVDLVDVFLWRIINLVLIISTAITLATVYVLGILVINPLLNLRDQIQVLRRSLFSSQSLGLEVERKDEIGDVSRAVQETISTLEAAEQTLRDLNAELEERVKTRTRDLTLEIAERKLADTALRESEDRFRDFAKASSDWFWEMDQDLRFSYFSERFEEVSGIAPERILGTTSDDTAFSGFDEESWQKYLDDLKEHRPFRDVVCSSTYADGREVYTSISGTPVFDEEQEFLGYRGVGTDITKHKQAEAKLQYQANFDELTDLPNRELALDRLSQAVALARRQDGRVALLFIDLDDFKYINDTLGHAAGDELLAEASQRLKSCVRMSDTVARVLDDTVARLGGDEFLVILPDIASSEDAAVVANKILKAFGQPFDIAGHSVMTTASIGITGYPMDSDDPYVLLKNADAAMYRAKAKEKNSYQFFTQEINDIALKQMSMESQLRNALDRQELYLHYQPIVDAKSRELAGVEALIRWKNPELGQVPPSEFIVLAEARGLIGPIGEWVLRTACRQVMAWVAEGGPMLQVAVNISSRQFRQGRMLETVAAALDESGLPPEYLKLEITENLLLDDVPDTLAIMKELNARGIQLSIDDFGTGYSSLSYLKRFPFSFLKIDGSFVRNITTEEEDAALASAIIEMAHSLSLVVIGEGVETKEQLKFLAGQGCDLVQGYYFDRPLSPEKFSHRLKIAADNGNSWSPADATIIDADSTPALV